MAVAETRLTLEQFLQFPEETPGLEFAEGMVSRKVSPKGKHSRIQFQLAKHLDEAASPIEGALVFPELRTTFAGASCVPDLSVYRRDRIPVDGAGSLADEFRLPPDIAVEIASPQQSVNALVRRCLWYVDNDVRIALLIDPQDESVLIFHPSKAPAVRRGKQAIELTEVLPDFALTVEELFASLAVR